jgi:polyphosphate kinase
MVSNSRQAQKKPPKISGAVYKAELFRLRTEFVKLQEWARFSGARFVVIFEGRDGAGTGRGTSWNPISRNTLGSI